MIIIEEILEIPKLLSQNLRVNNINVLYFVTSIIFLWFSSCGNYQNIKTEELTKVPSYKNYSGHAFVFSEQYRDGNMILFFPVDEDDSTAFKNMDVLKSIKGKTCIELELGCFTDLYPKRKNSKLISVDQCNFPGHTWFYSRAFISYRNYDETIIDTENGVEGSKKLNQRDSCRLMVIEGTDSSKLSILHYYD
jgi:hypothetical protein